METEDSHNLMWFGFWIFAAVFVAVDSYVFAQGYDSLLQSHKTPAEKELLKLKIKEKELKIELLKRGEKSNGE